MGAILGSSATCPIGLSVELILTLANGMLIERRSCVRPLVGKWDGLFVNRSGTGGLFIALGGVGGGGVRTQNTT